MLAWSQNGLDHILMDLSLLFALCIAVVVVFHRLRIPPVAGFLVTGALFGPHALGLVKQPEMVAHLAEIGVVVLLFTVGMELSLKNLMKMRRMLFLGGGLQVLMTVGLGVACSWLGGLPLRTALFLGFLLSLSSTAAISKLLQDRGDLNSPVGRLAMSICVAQDLAVVPMILFLPLLEGGGGAAEASYVSTLLEIGESFLYLLLTSLGAWILVPKVLDLVSRTRSREVFVLAVFSLCLAAATVTSYLGLSLAIGAFLVGLVISESGYHHQAMSEVAPFRDALSSLFFVSIGMLFDYRVILEHPLTVASALALVVFGKALVVWVVSRILTLPSWVGIRTALLMAQVGEFSFVLVQVARGRGLMPGGIESVFFVAAVLSITITPLLLVVGRRLTQRRGGKVEDTESGLGGRDRRKSAREDHVIIVGFGPAGKALARALQSLGIPFVVVEMNGATVNEYRALGTPIFLGDSTRETVLRAAAIDRARLLVLAVNDPYATRSTADLAKRIAPKVHVVARTTYLGEVPALQALGVHEVVPQELETSVEILARVLRQYLVPDDEVDRQVRVARGLVPGLSPTARPEASDSHRLAHFLPGLSVEILKVHPDSSVAGMALLDSGLRHISGCTVVAVKRGNKVDIRIRPDTVLEEDDIVVLLGPVEGIARATCLFLSPHDQAKKAEKAEKPASGTAGISNKA